MSRFKPQLSYISEQSFREWQNASSWNKKVKKTVTIQFDTYAELKKKLKEHIELCIEVEGVNVVRSKRGQWGEWFEYWKLDDAGSPYIDKEGWN